MVEQGGNTNERKEKNKKQILKCKIEGIYICHDTIPWSIKDSLSSN
jgi:hypothetical protein